VQEQKRNHEKKKLELAKTFAESIAKYEKMARVRAEN
jgi:hypothetical protein